MTFTNLSLELFHLASIEKFHKKLLNETWMDIWRDYISFLQSPQKKFLIPGIIMLLLSSGVYFYVMNTVNHGTDVFFTSIPRKGRVNCTAHHLQMQALSRHAFLYLIPGFTAPSLLSFSLCLIFPIHLFKKFKPVIKIMRYKNVLAIK